MEFTGSNFFLNEGEIFKHSISYDLKFKRTERSKEQV